MGQMDIIWAKSGPNLGQIWPKRPILKNRNLKIFTHSTFLKVITNVKLLEPTPVTKWAKIEPSWAKIEPSWAKIGPSCWAKLAKRSKCNRSTCFDTCPFGSRHRFDCYDNSQGIS